MDERKAGPQGRSFEHSELPNSLQYTDSSQEEATDSGQSHSDGVMSEQGSEEDDLVHDLDSPAQSVVDEKRRHSLGSEPFTDMAHGFVIEDEETQLEKKRLSFIMMHETELGSFAELCYIFVDDEELQEAAELVQEDSIPRRLAQHELAPMLAVLYESYRTLRHEMVDMEAHAARAKRQKLIARRHILSIKMPDLMDEFDLDSDKDVYSDDQSVQGSETDSSPKEPQADQNIDKRERKKMPDAPQTDQLASMALSSQLPRGARRLAELEWQLEDMNKRHAASLRQISALKNERRKMRHERDRYRTEYVELQRARSQKRYGELHRDVQQLKEQNKELQQQRQDLLQVSNAVLNTLPSVRRLQSTNQRANQIFWERGKVQADVESLRKIVEGKSGSNDTMTELMRHREVHGDIARVTENKIRDGNTQTMDYNDSYGALFMTDEATALRERRPTAKPVIPGKGLEASRILNNRLLRPRPGSIDRATKRVKELPRVAQRGSLLALQDRESDPSPPRTLRGASQPSYEDSTDNGEQSGLFRNSLTTEYMDIARLLAEMPANTPGLFAWQHIVARVHEDPNSPQSGLTKFFDIADSQPTSIYERAIIRYDIRGSDRNYDTSDFHRGEAVLVQVDGMHDLWSVKRLEDPQHRTYVVPRNAITLVCGHGFEYKDTCEAIRQWPAANAIHSDPECLIVRANERFDCAHVENFPSRNDSNASLSWRCVKSQDGARRGWVPADALRQLFPIRPRLTSSWCPCAQPQPYIGRARILVDCKGSPESLQLKERDEVQVAHLDTDRKAYCVRDPKTRNQGFIDPVYVRILRNPIAKSHHANSVLLQLTPRFLDAETQEVNLSDLTEMDMTLMGHQVQVRGYSNKVKRQWEQNVDGTNPQHKNFDTEMAKSRPFKLWMDWQMGPPDRGEYYIVKEDFDTIKDRPELKNLTNTWAFKPSGPITGNLRARSKSVPALRNPAYLTEREQERELISKRSAHIGHQPHHRIADGVCLDRDFMSEPVTGEPPDLKRKLIYIKEDGTLRAIEAEHEVNAEDLDMWKFASKTDVDWTAWRQPGLIPLPMPVEEDVCPPLDASMQHPENAFMVLAAPQSDPLTGMRILDVFRHYQTLKFDIVYCASEGSQIFQNRSDISENDRFKIVDIEESGEGTISALLVARVETDTVQAEDALATGSLRISPHDLDPTPFLRTALLGGEVIPPSFTLKEREAYHFVMVRETSTGIWNALHRNRIVPMKRDMVNLEAVQSWRPLESVIRDIDDAYMQQRPLKTAESTLISDSDFTAPAPRIEDWDFWYPVITEHIGHGDGFLDIEGPDKATGVPTDHVRVEPGSSDSEVLVCRSFSGEDTGFVHASVVDFTSPCLPMFGLTIPTGEPPNDWFLVLKQSWNALFVSFQHKTNGWVDPDLLSFDDEECQMISLRTLFENHLLDINDFEGASDYIRGLRETNTTDQDEVDMQSASASIDHQQETVVAGRSQPLTAGPMQDGSATKPATDDHTKLNTSSGQNEQRMESGDLSSDPDAQGTSRTVTSATTGESLSFIPASTIPLVAGAAQASVGRRSAQQMDETYIVQTDRSISPRKPQSTSNNTIPQVPFETRPVQTQPATDSVTTSGSNHGTRASSDFNEPLHATQKIPPEDGILVHLYDDCREREEQASENSTETTDRKGRSRRNAESHEVTSGIARDISKCTLPNEGAILNLIQPISVPKADITRASQGSTESSLGSSSGSRKRTLEEVEDDVIESEPISGRKTSIKWAPLPQPHRKRRKVFDSSASPLSAIRLQRRSSDLWPDPGNIEGISPTSLGLNTPRKTEPRPFRTRSDRASSLSSAASEPFHHRTRLSRNDSVRVEVYDDELRMNEQRSPTNTFSTQRPQRSRSMSSTPSRPRHSMIPVRARVRARSQSCGTSTPDALSTPSSTTSSWNRGPSVSIPRAPRETYFGYYSAPGTPQHRTPGTATPSSRFSSRGSSRKPSVSRRAPGCQPARPSNHDPLDTPAALSRITKALFNVAKTRDGAKEIHYDSMDDSSEVMEKPTLRIQIPSTVLQSSTFGYSDIQTYMNVSPRLPNIHLEISGIETLIDHPNSPSTMTSVLANVFEIPRRGSSGSDIAISMDVSPISIGTQPVRKPNQSSDIYRLANQSPSRQRIRLNWPVFDLPDTEVPAIATTGSRLRSRAPRLDLPSRLPTQRFGEISDALRSLRLDSSQPIWSHNHHQQQPPPYSDHRPRSSPTPNVPGPRTLNPLMTPLSPLKPAGTTTVPPQILPSTPTPAEICNFMGWKLVYILLLAYFLLGAWMAREEWMYVNGSGVGSMRAADTARGRILSRGSYTGVGGGWEWMVWEGVKGVGASFL